MIQSLEDDEPKTLEEALSSPTSDKWKKAMEEEMKLTKVNKVKTIVDLPQGRRAIKNKWVLKLERKVNVPIERYKAFMVAKGYTQQEGIDSDEKTFSPIVGFTSIQLLLSILPYLDLELL